MAFAAAMRNAGGDHAIVETRARRHPDAAVVEEGALAAFGGESIAIRWIVDKPRD